MKVLSLFNGMSFTAMALEDIGIEVGTHYSSEIDKYANQATQALYPNTIQLGDITKWEDWDLPEIDLIVGGFPCTSYSVAGKRLGTKCPKNGRLIYDFIDVLKHHKPKYFLIENVKGFMSIEKGAVLDLLLDDLKGMGYNPEYHLINSALISAQNRQRIYITNIPGITQPEDKGILLKDIIESDGFGCTYNRKDGLKNSIEKAHCMSASDWRGLNRNQNQTAIVDRDKSHCIDANYYKGGNLKSYFEKHRRQLVFSKDGLCHVGDADLKGNDSIKRVYHPDGKSPTLTTMGGGHREPKILNPASIVGRRINERGVRDDYNKDVKITQCLQVKHCNKKTGCLTTVDKDNVLSDMKPGRYIDVYNNENLTYRKLTPKECFRLQTVPEDKIDILLSAGEVETRYQALYNDSEQQKELSCKKNVKSKNVINQSHIKKLNSAINTIIDSLPLGHTKHLEGLSIKASNVRQKGVSVTSRLTEDCVLNTISNGKDSSHLKKLKNVRFALGISEVGGVECALDTQTLKDGMETQTKLTSMSLESLHRMEIRDLDTLNLLMVDGFIELSLKKLSEGHLEKERLYTILMVTNLIIAKAIFMCAPTIKTTLLCIDSSNLLLSSSLETKLSFLKMENIKRISNSNLYKMAGNGFTMKVISHIFKAMKADIVARTQDIELLRKMLQVAT